MMPSDADRFGFRGTQGRRPDLHQYQARELRSDFDAMPGVRAAQKRLVVCEGRIYAAFNSLEIMDVDAMLDYIEAPLAACGLPKDQYGRVVGVILGAIMVAVEADREGRDMDP